MLTPPDPNNPLAHLSAPAQRALTEAGWTTLAEISRHRASELLHLHGVGPKTIRMLEPLLHTQGLRFLPEKGE
jgi:hypothetical protein